MRVSILLQVTADDGTTGSAEEVAAFEKMTEQAEDVGLSMRDELLNETLFTSLAHAREAVASWADDYNAERPHSSLGYATPAAYAAGLRLAASRAVATVANDGDNTRRSLVAAG